MDGAMSEFGLRKPERLVLKPEDDSDRAAFYYSIHHGTLHGDNTHILIGCQLQLVRLLLLHSQSASPQVLTFCQRSSIQVGLLEAATKLHNEVLVCMKNTWRSLAGAPPHAEASPPSSLVLFLTDGHVGLDHRWLEPRPRRKEFCF